MQVGYPIRFDGRGHTGEVSGERHIRDLIEQVLFTSPGERVNRPAFGSGVLRLVFAPNGDEMAAATQLAVHGALQQWLGELIEIQAVEVQSDDATLRVLVRYMVRRTGRQALERFERGAIA